MVGFGWMAGWIPMDRWLDLDGRMNEKSDLLGHLESASHMVEEPSVQYL